jgi:hypothetical protein
MTSIVEAVDVNAPAQRVWDTLVDWPRQGEWLLLTRVRATDLGGRGVGGGVEAWTGAGPVGFLDPMTITEWVPPHRCAVRHEGKVVRGGGQFDVIDLGEGRSRFVWSEELDLPLGRAGRFGWPLVRPWFLAGVMVSLRRFRRLVEASA